MSQAVFEALDELHATTPPEGLPPLTLEELHTWREVEADPQPFLSLGLCTAAWLERALPELLAATERCVVTGDSFCHLDTRSDNICIADGRAILVDWNWAAPESRESMPRSGCRASMSRVARPPHGAAARGRRADSGRQRLLRPDRRIGPTGRRADGPPLQLAQLKVALPWAVDVLGLPPLTA